MRLGSAGVSNAKIALIVACVSTLIVNANTSAVTILLPAISADTGTSTDILQWAVTGYSLVGAAVIVTSGALGDVFGRRKVFIGGLLLFIGSCVLIALSETGTGVIVGRAIQGASGATILASGMSILSVASSGKEQLKAISIWGAASAVGAAVGPLVGGALVGLTGWQGLFWIDAGIAAVLIPLTIVGVAESRDPSRPRSIDWTGSVLIALCLAPLILAFTEASSWGWLSPGVIICALVSIGAAVGFFLVEKKVKAPLVDLELLRNRILVAVTLVILIGAGTINALMYILSLYFQNPAALGMTPLEAGLATLPAALGMILFATAVAKLANKVGSRKVILWGFVLMTAGFTAMAFIEPGWVYLAFVLPLVAIAVGMGATNGPASSVSTSCVPDEEVGQASGISNMARYVGAAVATALIAAIYAGAISSGAESGISDAEALANGVSQSSIVLAVVSALGIVLATRGRKGPAAKPSQAIDYAAHAASTSHTLPVPAGGGAAIASDRAAG